MPKRIIGNKRFTDKINIVYFNTYPRPSLEVLRKLLEADGFTVSKSTLRRYMDGTYVSRQRAFTVALTDKARAARKIFAEAQVADRAKYDRMIFSDEKLFCYQSSQCCCTTPAPTECCRQP